MDSTRAPTRPTRPTRPMQMMQMMSGAYYYYCCCRQPGPGQEAGGPPAQAQLRQRSTGEQQRNTRRKTNWSRGNWAWVILKPKKIK